MCRSVLWWSISFQERAAVLNRGRVITRWWAAWPWRAGWDCGWGRMPSRAVSQPQLCLHWNSLRMQSGKGEDNVWVNRAPNASLQALKRHRGRWTYEYFGNEMFSICTFASLELSEWRKIRFLSRFVKWKADCFCEPVRIFASVSLLDTPWMTWSQHLPRTNHF